jgi:hypothetical protein
MTQRVLKASHEISTYSALPDRSVVFRVDDGILSEEEVEKITRLPRGFLRRNFPKREE